MKLNFDQAILKLNEANANAVKAMQHDYPVEAIITYRIGAGLHVVATVIEHGYGLRLKVRGQNSGNEYWLDPRRISSVLSQSVKRR